MSEIEALFDQLDPFKIPPLHCWHPEKSVDLDIHIRRDGKWNYRGTAINRHRIAKLFSTVLRLEEGNYFLVTPPVKYRIRVDDAPFNAVELRREMIGTQQLLHFRTNMDEVVLADRSHPISVLVDPKTQEPSPYVEVRQGLRAKLTRPVYYEMTELLEPDPAVGSDEMGVTSAGEFFSFGTA